METVTLRSEDFKTIHNTLCDLRSLVARMEQSMIKIDDVQRIVEGFEQGLRNAYEQDEAQFDSKMDYYSEYQREHDFAAIWSMYELPIHGFLENHPYPSDAFVVYGRGHVPVMGPTWGDLYRAADCAIRNSGDDHHIFIEAFTVNQSDPQLLVLHTGS